MMKIQQLQEYKQNNGWNRFYNCSNNCMLAYKNGFRIWSDIKIPSLEKRRIRAMLFCKFRKNEKWITKHHYTDKLGNIKYVYMYNARLFKRIARLGISEVIKLNF